MALDPSEIHRTWHVDYDNNQSELENEHNSSESERLRRRNNPPRAPVSNDLEHVPRWCREEILLPQIKASASGASSRKRKSPASTQELPPSRWRKSDDGYWHDERGENDFREMKHLLQKLCRKVEKNEDI